MSTGTFLTSKGLPLRAKGGVQRTNRDSSETLFTLCHVKTILNMLIRHTPNVLNYERFENNGDETDPVSEHQTQDL